MPPKTNIKDELDSLALKIAEHAKGETVSFPDKLDAFKALTAYHLGLSKAKSKEPDEKPKGDTFDGFRKSVKTSG